MRRLLYDAGGRNIEWTRAATVVCLALALAAAALDRRNAILDRIAAPPRPAAHPTPVTATDAMVLEMMTHD